MTALGLPLDVHGLLAPLFAGLPGELRAVLEGAEAATGTSEPARDPTEVLERELHDVVSAWEQGLVVFVDDLDRCNPDSIVTLLDAIRRIVCSAERINCRFVVALDRGVASAAIAQKFAGVPRFDANRYLEKVFPVSFHLGSLPENDGRRLLSRLVRTASDRVQADIGAALDPSVAEGLRAALDEPLFFNPRLLKRCINRFYLALTLAGGGQVNQYDDHKSAAQWIAATERWPRIRPLLQRHQDEFWLDLLRAALARSEPRPTDAEARLLLEEPGIAAWLSRAVGTDLDRLAALRRADARLRGTGL
jgi:hypothetical protein